MNPASFHIAAPFLAADWFQLVAILMFFLISALTQYFQKRANERKRTPRGARPEPIAQTLDTVEPQPPPVVHERPLEMVDDWQEQIRRMLEGADARRESPPLLSEPPAVFSAPISAPEAPPLPDRVSEIRVSPVPNLGMTGGSSSVMKTASKLRAAVEAYREASNLGKIVQTRLRESRMHQSAPRARQISIARRSSSISGTFRKPGGMRQAIIAAAVLQPPTALASEDRFH